jgi:predicted lipoprotein with Yx(FWY)xxD motif
MTPHRVARALRTVGLVTALGLATLGGPAAQAQSAAPISVRQTSDLGTILTDQSGRTLYLFTKDTPGTSTCYDQCAVNWPPLLASDQADLSLPDGVPGTLGTTQRSDGTTQLTYNGMPLYYWIADQQPGDTTGQHVGGVWFVINPAADSPAAQDGAGN